MTTPEVTRHDSPFVSDGANCAAWLYRPAPPVKSPLPVVVMAHGFAAQRSFGLARYAKRFAAAGMAVLLFDYRHFGDSEGEPRDLVDHRRQHRDWLAAIEHARQIDGIDGSRVGLWGTSFSGGHVIAVAAELCQQARRPEGTSEVGGCVQAVCAQVPMLDVPRASRISSWYFIRAVGHIAADYLSALLGRRPHYIPAVAPPHRFAVMNQPGSDAGYRSIIPDDAEWQNRCTARSLWTSLSFRPAQHAPHVSCPVLMVIAERDQIIRASVLEKAATMLPRVRVLRYPTDHFAVYEGHYFESILDEQTSFLAEHLGAAQYTSRAERC